MSILKTMFRSGEREQVERPPARKSWPGSPDPAAVRSSLIIEEDIDDARRSAVRIAERLGEAEAELQAARLRLDEQMAACAVNGGREPNGAELADAAEKVDALRRVRAARESRVAFLVRELAARRVIEAEACGREVLPLLVSKADVCLEAFLAAVAEAARLEKDLYGLLYYERGGLRQRFSTPELRSLAARERKRIAREMMKRAARTGYKVHPNFETDGEVNLGMEWPDLQRERIFAEKHPPRRHEPAGDIGELIVDEAAHARINGYL